MEKTLIQETQLMGTVSRLNQPFFLSIEHHANISVQVSQLSHSLAAIRTACRNIGKTHTTKNDQSSPHRNINGSKRYETVTNKTKQDVLKLAIN